MHDSFDIMTLDLVVDNKPELNEWCSKDGIIDNMGTVVSEFNKYRGLKPNKIMVLGNPAAGLAARLPAGRRHSPGRTALRADRPAG